MAEPSEMANQQKRQKKSRKPFGKNKKPKHEDKLCVGMRGIMVFGATNESKGKKEAYNLLNEYADELFGSELLDHVLHRNSDKKMIVDCQHGTEDGIIVEYEEDNTSSSDEEEDIEKAIAREIDQIKRIQQERRFQGIVTGVKGILFIKSTLSNDNLNKLVHHILCDLEKTKQSKARNFTKIHPPDGSSRKHCNSLENRSFQRLIPVTEICHADLASMRKTATQKFLPEFDDDENGPVKFCINFKSRFNSNLTRGSVLSEISAIFLNAGHKVDLTSPDKIIVIEVMKNLCCMNVLKDFFRFKKYNVHEITRDSKEKGKSSKRSCPRAGEKDERPAAESTSSVSIGGYEDLDPSSDESP